MRFKKIIFVILIFSILCLSNLMSFAHEGIDADEDLDVENVDTYLEDEPEDSETSDSTDFSVRKVEIDISQIANNFNNHSYVEKLSNIDIKVSAIQNGNDIVLNFVNGDVNDSVTFNYDPDEQVLTGLYLNKSSINRDTLAAIFIDTVSVMQGNIEGQMIPYVYDDTLCYSFYSDTGIQKDIVGSSDGVFYAQIRINPFLKMTVPTTSSAIESSDYTSEYQTLYSDDDCFVKCGDLIFYRHYNDDGTIDIYIGQKAAFSTIAYNSFLNYVPFIFKNDSDKAVAYFRQSYYGFDKGDTEFDGVTVSTQVDGIPVSNIQTVMVVNNMVYSKVTINPEVVNEMLPDVVIENPSVGDSTESNGKVNYWLIAGGCLIIVVAIIVFIKIKRS